MAKREFKGIWIPKHIWINKNLSINEKILLMEIDSYDNDFGCIATNKTLCEDILIQPSTVSGLIKSLQEKGYINIEYKNLNTFEGRKITVTKVPFEFPKGASDSSGGASDSSKPSNPFSNTFSKNIKDILLSEVSISDIKSDSPYVDYYKIATAFLEVFKKNKIILGDKNIKYLDGAKFQAYTDPIRLLIVTDGYTKEDVLVVYNFLKGENSKFWKPNILSTSKLRDKFSRLLIEAKKTEIPKEELGYTPQIPN